jgi:hypothetical protein
MGKRRVSALLAGATVLLLAAAGCRVVETTAVNQPPNDVNQNGGKPAASTCPASQALGNFLADANVAAGFNTSSNTATYWFASLTNENPANGVPGLIKYCVYSASGVPTAITPVATGADGTAWTANLGANAFSFGRPNGDPSNIPLDGASAPITIGTATWTAVPNDQSILLHINDATVCAGLYGVGTQSCFVTPGQATVCVVNAGATNFAYNAIPFGAADCPGASEAFEATGTKEFGDEVTLAGIAPAGQVRFLDSVTVLFASYACTSGNWSTGDCVTNKDPVTGKDMTFTHDVTANIYSVSDCVGNPAIECPDQPPVATVTQTLTIPYRPSADAVNCPGTGKWFNPVSGKCQNSISVLRTFDFTDLKASLPDNVIWTVAFNTTDYGSPKIGPMSCNSGPGGCPYDSFNVGAQTFANAPYGFGIDADPGSAFVNAVNAVGYCDNGVGGLGSLRQDGGFIPCTAFQWSDFKPLGRIATHFAAP